MNRRERLFMQKRIPLEEWGLRGRHAPDVSSGLLLTSILLIPKGIILQVDIGVWVYGL